jgi:ABC-type sugar transport system ATPase subunit
MQDGQVTLERGTHEVTEEMLVEAIAGGAAEERRRTPVRREDARPLLRVSHLSRPPVVRDVSFDLHAGEILGLAGLVGSGRTEVARMLFGADVPQAGTIEVDGIAVRFREPLDAIRRGIALLPEDRRHEGLVLDFTTRENITLASLPERRWHRFLPAPSRAKERRAAGEMVSRLSIQTAGVEQLVRRLSGGNQQKVVLAKWLQRSDRILLFDEPSQGVDVGAKQEIFLLIERLAAEGRGVIVISSDFSELAGLCTRVVGLREGRVTGVLTGAAITEPSLVRLAYAPSGEEEQASFAAVEG